MTIADHIKELHQELDPKGVQLVAVSKFHPVEKLIEAYEAGQRIFGESRVQELVAKRPNLPADTRWHFIGHLQTNKVKQIIGNVELIESVDTIHLLDIIDEESAKKGVITKVLMQLHVAQEETKYGFSVDELLDYFATRQFEKLKATHICGVMGMASNTDDTDRIRCDFTTIKNTFDKILALCPDLRGFNIVSMGMSDDHKIAIECGSNLVRIGTDIFGQREY